MAAQTDQTELLGFVTDWVAGVDPMAPPEVLADQEQAIFEFVGEIEVRDTRLMLANALAQTLRPDPRIDQLLYDSRSLIEIPAAKLEVAAERLLNGKNPAIVVRAGQYEDFDDDILQPLMSVSGLSLRGQEIFPREGNGLGHSRVHLDASRDQHRSYFPDGLTVSRVDRGQVVFIAGLAKKTVHDMSELQYVQARERVNSDRRIVGLEERAVSITPRGPGYEEWSPQLRTVSGNLIATTLSAEDVVIWPQGNAGAKIPAWHGFFQVGNRKSPGFVPRQSTSYHLR